MKRDTVMIRAFFFVCLSVHASLAWWEFGHVMVARIAYEDLAANNLTSILDEAVDLALFGAELSPNMTKTFEGVSLWADDMKSMQSIHIWDTWHFIDLPILQDGTPVTPENNPNNALEMIQDALTVLTQPETRTVKTIEKASLLRFLIHIVGDIHQPLHTAAYYSQQYKKGDQGGNYIKITWEASHTDTISNLHALWDAIGGLFPSPRERPMSQESLDMIAAKARETMSQYPRSTFEKELKDKNVAHWVKQSYVIARDTIYPTIFKNKNVIDENIQNLTYEIAIRQVALAGYRLADLMKSIFRPELSGKNYRVSLQTLQDINGGSWLKSHLRRSRRRNC